MLSSLNHDMDSLLDYKPPQHLLSDTDSSWVCTLYASAQSLLAFEAEELCCGGREKEAAVLNLSYPFSADSLCDENICGLLPVLNLTLQIYTFTLSS